MKRLFSRRVAPLLLVSFLAIGLSYAMEENTLEPIAHEIEEKETDSVVERMYNAFSKELGEKFTSTPHNFYEAIVRLKSIGKLLEQSGISPEIFGEKFTITPYECRITTDKIRSIPQDILHPIFNDWMTKVHAKIFLEHPKSIEAIEVVLKAMSTNVIYQNVNSYQKVIKALPQIASQSIQNKFIDMHGWPYDIKPFITFDENRMTAFSFVRDDYHYVSSAIIHPSNPNIILMGLTYDNLKNKELGPTHLCSNQRVRFDRLVKEFNKSDQGVKYSLEKNVKEEDSKVISLWETPTFEEALEKRAQENETQQQQPKSNCIIC